MSPSIINRRQFTGQMAIAAGALAFGSSRVLGQKAPGRRWPIVGFTKPFQNLSFDDAADMVAEIGWDGIECPVRPQGQIEPERAPDQLPRLVEALARRGKTIAIMTTGITSASQPHAEQLLRTAAKLGIKRYRLGFQRYDLGKPIGAQVAEFGAKLRDLAALSRELGLQGGYENHSGTERYFTIGGPIWDLWSVMHDLDPRDMGVCFDIGHATVDGGTSWRIQAQLMQNRFTAVYVKDFIWQRSGTGWIPQWVPLGEGMVNRDFFRWLGTTDYTGPISQHHEYDYGQGATMVANLRKDLQTLHHWLAELG